MVQGAKTTTNLWYFGINLMNLNNITIQNVGIANTPAYHMRLSNVGNVTVSGCTLYTPDNAPSTDGVHFDGPANDIAISNCNFTCGDDAIALNCPEGYTGNISRVTVTDCTFNSLTMLRLYTVNGARKFNINSVTVSNCHGTFTRAAFAIGEAQSSNPNSVDGLSVSNCRIVSLTVLDLAANFGTATFSDVTFTPLYLNPDVGYAFARTSSPDFPITYAGASLLLENCVIQRNRNEAVAALILEDGSTIDQIEFSGFSVQDAPGSSYAATPDLLAIASGTIGQVVINTLDGSHVTALTSAGRFASIGKISGAGVLATGWQFPDNSMANETPYLSANSHRASIKLGGVVKPYP
jgi:polygalacturonase